MGCVYSGPRRSLFGRSLKTDTTGGNAARTFKVANVDDRGQEINYGDIEITDTNLLLHQKGRNSIVWPLRSLRRYGFDAELFSFECGRRCPTGPGIYAFRCQQAEQLFNVLQEAIQNCTTSNFPPLLATGPTTEAQFTANANGMGPAVVLPALQGGQPLIGGTGGAIRSGSGHAIMAFIPEDVAAVMRRSSRISSPPHNYANDVRPYSNSPFYVNTNQAGSNGGGNPTALVSQTLPVSGSGAVTDINTNYAKLDDLVSYYVNIKTPAATAATTSSHIAPTTSSEATTNSELVNNPAYAATKEPTTTTSPDALETPAANDHKAPFPTTINVDVPRTSTGSSHPSTPTASEPPVISSDPSESDSRPPSRTKRGYTGKAPATLPPTSLSLPVAAPPRTPTDGHEPMNYIMLDLDSSTCSAAPCASGVAHIVTTGPATPDGKSPRIAETWTPPGTPTSTTASVASVSALQSTAGSLPKQSYVTIDFDRTIALSSAANHRKCV